MRSACLILLVCMSIPLVGCSQSRDLVATRQVSIQNDPGNNAVITGPEVIAKGNDIAIRGSVTRKEGNDTPLAGHVDISVIDESGNVTDTVAASLTPHNIPSSGERRSTFGFEAVGIPPAGSIIKATFVDELHPTVDYLSGMTSEGGGGTIGGGRGGGAGGGSHGSSGSAGTRMNQGGGGHGFHFGGGGHGGRH